MAINLNFLKEVVKSPLFWLGLLIRITLFHFTLQAAPVTDWYAPFINNSLVDFSLDPWSNWLALNKTPKAFPYGYVMWIAFLPLGILGLWIGLSPEWGYVLTLLLFDFALLAAFKLFTCKHNQFLLLTYWLSPILLFATYYLGLNDLIPILFLTLSLYTLKEKKVFFSGALLACAISAKLSMILSVPFFIIYFSHNKSIRQLFISFIKGLTFSSAVLLFPFLSSFGAIEMIRKNPEISKLYEFALPMGNLFNIYLTPLAYILAVYTAWSIKRINFDLFQAMLGVAFLVVVLLTPSSAGWYIWILPLLIYFQGIEGKKAFLICVFFGLIYILCFLNLRNLIQIDLLTFTHLISLLHTFLIATGTVLIIFIWRKTISQNDYFKLSRKPFVIGISGDSGSGKDTISHAIANLFGKHSVSLLSGDDYHLWDRQKPVWQVITHLNPMANDLESFSSDLIALSNGKKIRARHYDHETGKLMSSNQIIGNDIVIASGLHTLHLPILRECLDLKIFLNMDEDLRKQFKIIRDTQKRGHTESAVLNTLNKREDDSHHFIKPQIEFADLIFSIHPVNLKGLTLEKIDALKIKLRLGIQSRIGLNSYDISRALIGICGLHVNESWNPSLQAVELMVEGELNAEDLAMAADSLCPKMYEFLDLIPKWEDGILGLMQLFTLIHIDKLLTKRAL